MRSREFRKYSAESFSWYSRRREKACWTPGSDQMRLITIESSWEKLESSKPERSHGKGRVFRSL